MEKNKEIKRTPGKWIVNHFINELSIYSSDKKMGIVKMIYNQFPYSEKEVEANAEFICEAVNNYDKLKKDNAALQKALSTLTGMHSNLKEDNAALLEALKNCYNYFHANYGDHGLAGQIIMVEANEAIKKAKSK